MTNLQLQKLMDKVYFTGLQHRNLLVQLETEYEKRYGDVPSNVDDDFFIDTFHYASGNRITIKQMDESARHCNKLTDIN